MSGAVPSKQQLYSSMMTDVFNASSACTAGVYVLLGPLRHVMSVSRP